MMIEKEESYNRIAQKRLDELFEGRTTPSPFHSGNSHFRPYDHSKLIAQ